MPEIITKDPHMVLTILKEAGIKCGSGEKQRMLRSCPSEHFCSLPTGELCVYGVKNSVEETFATLPEPSSLGSMLTLPNIILLLIVLTVGFFLGRFRRKVNR